MQDYAKHTAQWTFSTVLRSICKKTSDNILKPCQEIDLSLEESLGGGTISKELRDIKIKQLLR